MKNSVQITVHVKAQKRTIEAPAGKMLLEILQDYAVFLPAVCAGKGICGKCRVRFLDGAAEPSKRDKRYFTREELEEGWRLACQAYPQGDCALLIEHREEAPKASVREKFEDIQEQNGNCGIAVDIGTTTIAMELIEIQTGSVLGNYTGLNHQLSCGADVISRMEIANSGRGEVLRKSIREDLREGLCALTKNRTENIRGMVISANTTMVHLLMGYSCETLGVYPFTPVNLDTIHTKGSELLGEEMEVTVCPGISAFVGGDITAGLYALEFGKREKPSLFLDLGTNGEMALGNQEKILVASTAMGPAFEGGNIVCGIGSIPGAVCGLTVEEGKAYPETIDGARPVGICGTGIVATLYELLKEGIMDETGRMEEPWAEEGFLLSREGNIRLYQQDIREIQLAKSAFRAGIETLLLNYGITYEEVECIFLAGGFGCQMNIHKAVRIGLLPAEWEEKIQAVGNTSLRGAAQYLMDPQAESRTKEILEKSEEISLSDSREFQEFYMEYMSFE